jgi:hypothetical protein
MALLLRVVFCREKKERKRNKEKLIPSQLNVQEGCSYRYTCVSESAGVNAAVNEGPSTSD